MTVTPNCEFKESEGPDTSLCHSHTEPGAAPELLNLLRSCWKGGLASVLWAEPVEQGDVLLE